MKCKFCKGKCVKYGVQIDGTQRYKCKKCGKTQQGDYKYKAYDADIDNQIVLLTKEGVGASLRWMKCGHSWVISTSRYGTVTLLTESLRKS